MDPSASHTDPPPFDFRSSQFERDALSLAQQTGQALWLCRQELFIAEGQAAEARAVLMRLPGAGWRPGTLH